MESPFLSSLSMAHSRTAGHSAQAGDIWKGSFQKERPAVTAKLEVCAWDVGAQRGENGAEGSGTLWESGCRPSVARPRRTGKQKQG